MAQIQSVERGYELLKRDAKLASLTLQTGATKEDETASKLKAELEKTLGEKEGLEVDAHASMTHEKDLKQEISHLRKLAETTRREAERAQNEVDNITVTLNNRPVHLDVKKKARGITAASLVENRKVYIAGLIIFEFQNLRES